MCRLDGDRYNRQQNVNSFNSSQLSPCLQRSRGGRPSHAWHVAPGDRLARRWSAGSPRRVQRSRGAPSAAGARRQGQEEGLAA